MSLVQPPFDDLLKTADEDRFLLSVVAAKRARQIRKMQQQQMERARLLQQSENIANLTSKSALSIAMDEIYFGDLTVAEPADESSEPLEASDPNDTNTADAVAA